jgi:predicted esterase
MKTEFLHDQMIGTRPVDLLKVTGKPTSNCMLFFHGTGQLGPSDGSQIEELDDYGYQKFASIFECDFDIIAPQAQKSYSEFDENIIDYLISLGYSKIFIAGFSLGGQETMGWIMKYNKRDGKGKIVGFLPVAGQMLWPLIENACEAVDMPVMAVHGDSDTAIGWTQSSNLIKLLKSCPTRKSPAVLRLVPGLGHTQTANWAFTPDKNHEVYKFIMSCFTPKIKEILGRLVLEDGKVIVKFDNGTSEELMTM